MEGTHSKYKERARRPQAATCRAQTPDRSQAPRHMCRLRRSLLRDRIVAACTGRAGTHPRPCGGCESISAHRIPHRQRCTGDAIRGAHSRQPEISQRVQDRCFPGRATNGAGINEPIPLLCTGFAGAGLAPLRMGKDWFTGMQDDRTAAPQWRHADPKR
ncbi:hypothetical protein D3C73_944840 [compost metagenome]